MSKKQWMVLLMLFLTYLLLGASMFYHIESRLEKEMIEEARKERIEINALLHENYMTANVEDQHEILKKLTLYCGKSVYNVSDTETELLKWDFYNSFYFAYTVVSTIGYGNLAPTNLLSRILMIFYAVVGIPMNGILLAQLGEFFSIVFIKAHRKYKSYKQDDCQKRLIPLETRKAGLAVQILMYLLPGFVMFIFFPAFLFSYYEGWDYDKAVYYAFVTLTTIGFGDYVAGQDNTKGSGILFMLYKIFLIAWISFGLGYIVMIMTFITRGMRSKKIIRLEHKLAANIKQTQSRIWTEFNKEVDYLRRVFNELQLSKVKRVYMDEYDYEKPPTKFSRSNSFPDLRQLTYGGLITSEPLCPRRRANSEVVPMESPIGRVVSETDLQRIDKTATFATHAMIQPAELLARLVNILGYIPPPPDDDEPIAEVHNNKSGVQGFSDKEILSTERPQWQLGGNKIPPGKPRSRAVSEVRLHHSFDSPTRNQEWTWSGPAASLKIEELMKQRRNRAKLDKESKSKFLALNLPKSMPLPRWIKQFSNKKTCQRTRNSVSAGDLDTDYNDYTSNPAEVNERSTYFTHTGAANLNSTRESSNLLEETSLADFLRALTALHTRVGAVPEEFVKKPQRKMGTASLTPPKLPSLLTLFSPLPGTVSAHHSNQNTVTSTDSNSQRRYSLMNSENSNNNSQSMYTRRSSLAGKRTRRFSLRPVVTPLGTTPEASPYLSGMTRKGRSSPPPAYTADNFVYRSPREALPPLESSRDISAGARRYSLRTTRADSPSGPAYSQINKSRWRMGILQRQINQMNIQKRVRAFSLSDVNVEERSNSDTSTPAVSPLALDPAVEVKFGNKDNKSIGGKTVTIVSPSLDARRYGNDGKTNGRTFTRAYSTINTPLPIGDSKPTINSVVIDMKDEADNNENIETVPTLTAHSSVINNPDDSRNTVSKLNTSDIGMEEMSDSKLVSTSFRSDNPASKSSNRPRVSIDSYKPILLETPNQVPIVSCKNYSVQTSTSHNNSDETDLNNLNLKISTGLDELQESTS